MMGGGKGHDGFKLVKTKANKKDSKCGTSNAKPKVFCKEDSRCTLSHCKMGHRVDMCQDYEKCDNKDCPQRHKFIREGDLKVCSGGLGNWCTVRTCQYYHEEDICTEYECCTDLSCPLRHSRYRKPHCGHKTVIIASFEKGEKNEHVEVLRTFLETRKDYELRDDDHVDQGGKVLCPPDKITPDEIAVALVTSLTKVYSIGGKVDLPEIALSCKLVNIPQQGGGTKKVVALTVFTPNVIDSGIQSGKLTPEALARACRLYELHHFYKKDVEIWGGWAKAMALSTNYVTSTIAATIHYDVIIEKVDGIDAARVIGESADQPARPLRLAKVKLSNIIEHSECDRIIRQSISSDTVAPTNKFKLSHFAVESHSIVLAGAVAEWWTNKTQESINRKMGATLYAQFNEPVVLSISYFGFDYLKNALGRKVHGLCQNLCGKLCYNQTNHTQTARVCFTNIHTKEQLHQLRDIAGGMPESSSFEEVAARLKRLGYAVKDVARSIGCLTSVRHARTSESSNEQWLQCTNPLHAFISSYNQFAVLDGIDPDSPAASARKALFDTLPPLDNLLVKWTTKHNSLRVSIHRCNEAITNCMAKMTPNTIVPVQAVVVCPPRDDFISEDGFITVYVPRVTYPSCVKRPPVIITIPASCARDIEGKPTNAFNTSACGPGRTVMLMMSLSVLSKLPNGKAVTAEDDVTLVPEVPKAFLPVSLRE